jgi:hypothetical protein
MALASPTVKRSNGNPHLARPVPARGEGFARFRVLAKLPSNSAGTIKERAHDDKPHTLVDAGRGGQAVGKSTGERHNAGAGRSPSD